jgi:hypothetical protein
LANYPSPSPLFPCLWSQFRCPERRIRLIRADREDQKGSCDLQWGFSFASPLCIVTVPLDRALNNIDTRPKTWLPSTGKSVFWGGPPCASEFVFQHKHQMRGYCRAFSNPSSKTLLGVDWVRGPWHYGPASGERRAIPDISPVGHPGVHTRRSRKERLTGALSYPSCSVREWS